MTRALDSGPYDYAVIGSGIGGLAIAALLAHAGKSVVLLERHNLPGGYGHTFGAGRYQFCAELHYVWDCGPGGRVDRFFRYLGLEDQVRFRRLHPDGFDRIVAPGIDYTIGSGFIREHERLSQRFPESSENLRRYYEILTEIHKEAYQLPLGYSWSTLLSRPIQYAALIRYMGWTLQDLFDLLRFPPMLQLILAGQSAIFFSPPKELSLIVHAAGVASYDSGAYVPEVSFSHVIHAMVNTVRHQPNCRVALATEVTKIHLEAKQAVAVTTAKGETLAARHIIFNGDPQQSIGLIGASNFPARFRQRLAYEYGISALSVYLGLRNLDLRKHGWGDANLHWHPSIDLNAVYERQFAESIPEEPYFFCDAPTLRMTDPHLAPSGGQQLVMVSPCRYEYFRRLRATSEEAYQSAKCEYGRRIIRILERDFLPGLSNHIETQVIGSPLTNERFIGVPGGNCYGMPLDPKHQNASHIDYRSPFQNLFYVGTVSGMPGFASNIHFATLLFEQLTGDCFYSQESGS